MTRTQRARTPTSTLTPPRTPIVVTGLDTRRYAPETDPGFTVSNESRPEYFAEGLSPKKGGGYVGLGAEQNFTLMGMAKPERAWIYDRSTEVMLQHALYQVAFRVSDSPDAFLAFFRSSPAQRDAHIQAHVQDPVLRQTLISGFERLADNVLERLHNLKKYRPQGSEGSFLSDPAKYQTVRDLVREDRVRLIQGSHANPAVYARIRREAATAETKPLTIRNLYLSNAHEGNYGPLRLICALPWLPTSRNTRMLISRDPAYSSPLNRLVPYESPNIPEGPISPPRKNKAWFGAKHHGRSGNLFGNWDYYSLRIPAFVGGYFLHNNPLCLPAEAVVASAAHCFAG